jgi:hypothetical protein
MDTTHVALVLNKVKLQVEELKPSVVEKSVDEFLHGGWYQSTETSKIQHCMVDIDSMFVDVISHSPNPQS